MCSICSCLSFPKQNIVVVLCCPSCLSYDFTCFCMILISRLLYFLPLFSTKSNCNNLWSKMLNPSPFAHMSYLSLTKPSSDIILVISVISYYPMLSYFLLTNCPKMLRDKLICHRNMKIGVYYG